MSGAAGRRSWPQRILLGLSVTLVVGLLVTAAGLGYAWSKYSRLARVQLGAVLTERDAPGEPQNILLVGVDSADNLDPDDPVRAGREGMGGLRSDSMMILRADPEAEEAHLLSIPRDLWVPLASGGNQRINTAIQIGGPGNLIDTIEEYLGIPINHYVQVDFAGFRGLVEAIEGVEVWFENPSRDRQSGLDVENPGCITLDAEQALAYVRARHLQTFVDGRWRTDPTGDHGRMSRQQDFIMRALRRAVDRGVRNPVTLDRLVNSALETVVVDDLLTADDIVDLGRRFRSFQPDRLKLHALPVLGGNAGGADILRLVDSQAQPVLDIFRGRDSAEAPTARGIRVRVLNGTGEAGQAAEVSEALVAAGFTAAGTGDAGTFGNASTVVRYSPGNEASADLVARYLVGGADLEEVEDGLRGDVVVVTGTDFAGVRDEPRPPSSSTTTEDREPTAGPSTTSTTLIGEVPAPPPEVDC